MGVSDEVYACHVAFYDRRWVARDIRDHRIWTRGWKMTPDVRMFVLFSFDTRKAFVCCS